MENQNSTDTVSKTENRIPSWKITPGTESAQTTQEEKSQEVKNPTPRLEPSGGEYASVGKRFTASIVDSIILGFIGGAIALSFTFASFLSGTESDSSPLVILGQLLILLFNFAYPVYFIGKKGQTLGKMAMGIKVVKVDEPDAEIGYLGAFIRESVGKLISALPLGLGYLWAIWDPKKQTWHDKIAKTVVVRVK